MGLRNNADVKAERGVSRPDLRGRDVRVMRWKDTPQWGLVVAQTADTFTVRYSDGAEIDHAWEHLVEHG